MEKNFYVSDESILNDYERKHGYVSFKRLIDRYVDNKVLCNNIAYADGFKENLCDALIDLFDALDDETKAEYNDDWAEYYESFEVFQYFITDCSEYEAEKLRDAGELLVYSDDLDCYVLCVTHWGTSWDYVLTNLKYTTNWNDEAEF